MTTSRSATRARGWPDAPVGSLRAWDAGVTWKEIETAPGEYTFDRLDAIVDGRRAARRPTSLLVLGQTPAFHATDPDGGELLRRRARRRRPRLKAWKAYVRAVAERYAGRRWSLQVWNEANVVGFWSGTQQQMAELTKAAYDAIADVVAATDAGLARDGDPAARPAGVARRVLRAARVGGSPVADFVDVVSLQLYPEAEGTPETSMELLDAMQSRSCRSTASTSRSGTPRSTTA